MATKTTKQNNRHAPRLTECCACGRRLPKRNYHGRCADCRSPDLAKRLQREAAWRRKVLEQEQERRHRRIA